MSFIQAAFLLGVVCLTLTCHTILAERNWRNDIYMGTRGPNWRRQHAMPQDAPVRQEAPKMMRQILNPMTDLDYIFGLMPFVKLPVDQNSTIAPSTASG